MIFGAACKVLCCRSSSHVTARPLLCLLTRAGQPFGQRDVVAAQVDALLLSAGNLANNNSLNAT